MISAGIIKAARGASRPRTNSALAACSIWSAVTILTLVAAGELTAQQTGTVEGVVRNEETGAAVEGASVQIEGPALEGVRENARMDGRTNRSGRYRLQGVPDGDYRLRVTLPGFRESSPVSLSVSAGEEHVQDFQIAPAEISSAYRVEDIDLPQQMSPEVSGVDFTPSGRIVLCNRRGEVWIGDLEERRWRRMAYGLYEPFGVTAESDEVIYVLQRAELTRLQDTTGDGRADRYETVSDDWGITGNYHEFAYGLRRDSRGNFYGGLGMASAGEFTKARGPLKLDRVVPWDRPERLTDHHRSVARYQGWVFQVTDQGKFVPWASGFRQPLGVAVSPDDDVFVTDVAGSWIPSSVLVHAEKGNFYGHPDGLKWDPRFNDQPLSRELLAVMRTPPAVFLTHGRLGTSPGEPVWDTTEGKFGPFRGQMFIGDVTRFIMRVDLEKVGGQYQGAAFPFIRERGLRQGNMRNVFGPDGHLYLGQTVRGWREDEQGLQRVVWTGEDPVEILSVRLTHQGFRLTFTEPIDRALLADPEQYQVTRFQYNYHILDGSLRINETAVPVTAVEEAEDGRQVELELEELQPGFVYQLEVPELRTPEGRPVDNPLAYYTANRLLSGETFVGLPVARQEQEEDRPPSVAAGRQIYHLYCAPCHGADGRGREQIKSASFVGEDSPLKKPNEELMEFIQRGSPNKPNAFYDEETGRLVTREADEEPAMPAFGQALTRQQIKDVLALLRDEFGDEEP